MQLSLEMRERTACYLCGASLDAAQRRRVTSREPLTIGTRFEVAICAGCGFGQSTPYPLERSLELLYEGPKAGPRVTLEARDFDVIRGTWIDRAKDWNAARNIKSRVLRQLSEPPREIVDFGSGNGRFAAVAHRLLPASKVYSVDYQESRPLALAGEVQYLTVEKFLQNELRVDLIWCRHVLEHSPDPVALLQGLARKLSPMGRIYVEVPNVESALARLAGKNWVGYYPPRHIFHFNQDTLASVLSKAELGGKVRKCELPIMGTQLQEWLGIKEYGPPLQVAGAALHPLQLLIEAAGRSSGCVMALAHQLPPQS